MKPLEKYRHLTAIQADLLSGSLAMADLVHAYLERIRETSAVNAYVRVFREEALEKARELDQRIRNGEQPGPLFGMVVSIKDVICYAGHHVTAASRMLEGYRSPFSATAVERLLASDAIIIGMVNCDEFAMGSSNENSAYGPTHNGARAGYVPGGSSGASAVAVQLDTCLVSLGSDTGGSVRQPAAFCGIIGLKPSYGTISRYGLIAYASSFDQIGILGWHIPDIRTVLECISGPDEKDSTTSAKIPLHPSGQNRRLSGSRIAHFTNIYSAGGVQEEVRTAYTGMLENLGLSGCRVDPVEFPLLDYIVPTYYILTMAEASSNLSRYDGVRYGRRADGVRDLDELYGKTRSQGFGTEVKRRIMLGTFVLSSGYYDAYFETAQKVRRKIRQEIESIFNTHDFIVLPTTPETAWKIGEKVEDPVSVYLSDIFTVLANLCGIPAISLPLGKDKNGLDFGIQLMSARYTESALLDVSQEWIEYQRSIH